MKKSTLLAIVLVLVHLVLEAQTPCPNTVINGDFEAGFSGFTSGLAYNCNCADATICVNSNFAQKCRGWSTLGNHTPGGSNYLIVDGLSGDPVNVWAAIVPVSPGDTYTFSFWVATAYVSRDLIFDLGMIVNGQTVRQFTVSQATPTWTQYSVSGICPVGLRSMPIAIRQMTGGSFRDFGIDDIYFACCGCKADYTTTNLDGCGKVQFNNTSIVPGGIGYSWDFGDTASGVNNNSTEPNPIHQFSKCGTYNVCLTLKGEGCSSKICYTVDASDNSVPFIICPRNQTVNTNPGQCYFTGTLPQPSASDNCDVSPEIVCSLITPTSSILITPQTQFPKGENTIVCFARDKCGNVSRSCAYILTVRDNQAPKITCPISTSVTGTKNAQGRCQAIVRGLSPTTSDNCTMLTVTYAISGATTATGNNDASGITFLEGVSTVTYTVVDMDGNKATCSFTVTVKCPPDPPAFPCDSLVVTKSKVDSGACCFSVNFNVHAGPVAYVEAESLTPGVTFSSPNLSSSFAFAGLPSSTLISIKHNPFKGIPQGNYPNALQFCLNNITQVPQMVVFRWYVYGPNDVPYLACADTLLFDCGGPCANNLVPNPSFEQFTTCPPGVAPPFTAAIWSLPSVGGSSDYYNSCAPAASFVSTPDNGFGTQVPRTGSGYAGFILRPTNLYREYLEVQLTTPLVAGNTYQVSFYVSLADQSKWAIDKFGTYLSVGSVGPINGAPVLPFVPQVMHPIGTFITDKTNWTQISGSYTATGGEDHLVIGNFYDNVATTPQMGQGGFYEGSYYYIDDVSVCATCVTPPCDSCCADSLTFAALVNQGFTVVNKGCSVTVTAPQFDSCYVFGTPPILDGANVPQVITDPSGSWTFNFTQSGVHQICVTVFDGCQSKKMCTTVRVNCDTCECGFLEWATFLQLNGGFSSPIRCGGNNLPALPVPCPKPGLDYLIHGNYHCIPDACGTKTVNWVLDRPGTLSDITGVSNAPYPHFDVSIPWNLCTTPGTYVLHISRNCGGKECPCSFKFEVPACPCSCDDLKADIAHGFNAVAKQAPGSCKRNFRPVSLCSNDIVSWSVNGVNLPGTTTGNNVKMITFSSSGIYTVCMTVIRTEPNGLRCEAKFCQKVKVKCNPGGNDPNVTFCANDVILNGDFTEGIEAGDLDRGPRKPWTPVFPSLGRSFVFGVDSSGSGDAGHLILNGGKGSFSGIWQQVNLSPNIYTTIEFDYKNYLGKSSPAGTVLEFRLEPDSISGGPSQILYRHVISDTSAAWTNVVVSVKTSPNPEFKYLVICLQNDDDALQSMVGIDNLSMCTRSISDTKNLSALKPIRIFPNPNPGSFNVELQQPATTGMTLRVTDLAGRLVLEKQAQTGNKLQTVQAENLAGGMYLLQLVEKGRVVGVEKFVKQ